MELLNLLKSIIVNIVTIDLFQWVIIFFIFAVVVIGLIKWAFR